MRRNDVEAAVDTSGEMVTPVLTAVIDLQKKTSPRMAGTFFVRMKRGDPGASGSLPVSTEPTLKLRVL